MLVERTSVAVTKGIRVRVTSIYLPDQSEPTAGRFVFAYHVELANEGDEPVRLRTRHWIISDANGGQEEVHGEGVVGETPRLLPGERFRYTSGCVLRTRIGAMEGSYRFFRDDGSSFDAAIAKFSLAADLEEASDISN